MREGTSGVWFTEEAGEISIGYEDYGVSEFGGGDFEKTYYLNKENSKKLKAALKKEYEGALEEMIGAAFGKASTIRSSVSSVKGTELNIRPPLGAVKKEMRAPSNGARNFYKV